MENDLSTSLKYCLICDSSKDISLFRSQKNNKGICKDCTDRMNEKSDTYNSVQMKINRAKKAVNKYTLPDILKVVCEVMDVSYTATKNNKNKKNDRVVTAQKIFCFYALKLTDYKVRAIGDFLKKGSVLVRYNYKCCIDEKHPANVFLKKVGEKIGKKLI